MCNLRPLFQPLIDLLGAAATAPESALLHRCLDTWPSVTPAVEPAPAQRWEPLSRNIDLLKMTYPRSALETTERWLETTLIRVRHLPDDADSIYSFCSALSTYSGLLRYLGRLGDAALASHKVLSVLSPQPYSTDTGFGLHRAAYVLADLGHIGEGLIASHHAVVVHIMLPKSDPDHGQITCISKERKMMQFDQQLFVAVV